MQIIITILIVLFSIQSLISQTSPHDIRHFDFIHYEKNKLRFYGDSSNLDTVFKTFDHITLRGEGDLHILHIGDSHIQADYLSGRIREDINNGIDGSKGSRGIVFPYRIVDRNTNDPFNYTWKWFGTWIGYKNTNRKAPCDFGLTGNYAFTATDGARLTFIQRAFSPYPKYDFDIIKIFHNTDSSSYVPEILNKVKIVEKTINYELGYTQYKLDSALQDTLMLRFAKKDSTQRYFELYGISLESSTGGITYSSCGVNGSDTEDWLRCNMLPQQLQAINPNMIIISLGTNDVYMKYFNEQVFARNYDEIIRTIRSVVPNAPIILTTPSDHYRSGMYLNKNTEKTHDIIHRLAQKHSLIVWDLYTIMGGQNSITLWYSEGLTAKDRLHYSKAGYTFQGDLFYSAFMKSYDAYLNRTYKPLILKHVKVPAKREKFDAIYSEVKKKKRK